MTEALGVVAVVLFTYAAWLKLQLRRLLRQQSSALLAPMPLELQGEVTEAFVEALECSLVARPEDWSVSDGCLVHPKAYLVIEPVRGTNNIRLLTKQGVQPVPGHLAERIVNAARIRNTVEMTSKLLSPIA